MCKQLKLYVILPSGALKSLFLQLLSSSSPYHILHVERERRNWSDLLSFKYLTGNENVKGAERGLKGLNVLCIA